MADLKETDEEVEKAVNFRGQRVSRAERRQMATRSPPKLRRHEGSWIATAPGGGKYRELFTPEGAKRALGAGWKVKTAGAHLGALNRRSVRKSRDSLTDLYVAIEKARPLLARGKDGVRRGTIGGVKVTLGRSGKSNGGARRFTAGKHVDYLPAPHKYASHSNPDSFRGPMRARIKRHLSRLKGVQKSAPVRVHFTIDRSKVEKNDITGRYAAGFASVIEKDGKRVTDTQDDVIFWDDLKETAHDYIRNERVAKVMHDGEMVGEVVESVLIDDDFAKALGLTDPRRGWFIKMDIADPATRELNKAGKFGGFSIGGSGQRVDLTE